jgi:hypothetical protein
LHSAQQHCNACCLHIFKPSRARQNITQHTQENYLHTHLLLAQPQVPARHVLFLPGVLLLLLRRRHAANLQQTYIDRQLHNFTLQQLKDAQQSVDKAFCSVRQLPRSAYPCSSRSMAGACSIPIHHSSPVVTTQATFQP